ncbi:MAG TPA: gamma-glutamyltransferase [Planctomycetota bacterium]|nr:gamma-glutamyltransferase [Planctomycetota bacterium]
MGWSVLILFALGLGGCTQAPEVSPGRPADPVSGNSGFRATGRQGIVVSISRPASEVGLGTLKRGGNAMDAAVATAFALAVSYPAAGNIGGGGFMLVHPAPGEGPPVVIDYRETAPAGAFPTMYGKDESQFTHRAVAIPGTVRGMALAHRRFGRLPWREVLRPAILLARDGVPLDRHLSGFLNEILAEARAHAEFQRVFGKPGGGLWQTGDRLLQPDLARTLELLASLGPDAFYRGPIADDIFAEMARGNGLITRQDLAGYQAVERQPLHTRYRGVYDVYVPPPPSSGGICLIEELNMLGGFDLASWGPESPQTLHTLAEVMRRANCDRARYLGDSAFVEIPARLTTPEYARLQASSIIPGKATPSRELCQDLPLSPEGDDTTHFSVIDRDGMAVANTYTLERLWGSRIVVKGAGFILNNDMRAFNLVPGVTDTRGALGTPPNVIAPGKRPLSSQSPTIVARDGRVFLVTGSPGSQSIPHTILTLLINTIDFKMAPEDAAEAPRLSHSWFPDEIVFECPEDYAGTMAALRERGHRVVPTGPRRQGDAHSIWVREPGVYVGVADRRRNPEASALGY